jgi:hypothetical protein
VKKPRPFDEALECLVWASGKPAPYKGQGAWTKAQEEKLRDSVSVLRAAGQYTADDDGTSWKRLVGAILNARKIESRKP